MNTNFVTSKPISRDFANKEIRRYLAYRNESEKKDIFRDLTLKGAQTYYSSDEVSFIFKKSELDNLFAGGDANAYRIYYGATPEGKPTLVVVPCRIDPLQTEGKDYPEDGYTVKNIIQSDMAAAQQYPTTEEPNGDSDDFDIADDDVPPAADE